MEANKRPYRIINESMMIHLFDDQITFMQADSKQGLNAIADNELASYSVGLGSLRAEDTANKLRSPEE